MRAAFCLAGGQYCSESQALEGVRIEHGKVVQIVALLTEGLGERGTASVCDAHPHTVLNVLQTVGAGCERLHERLVHNVKTDWTIEELIERATKQH
jgi:hypothetical protein